MNCPQCRAKVPDKFLFCPQCGTPVSGRTAKSAGAGATLNTVNLVLIGLLAANVIGGAFVAGGLIKKNQSAPETSVAEDIPVTTEAPPETTALPETTESPETADITTEKTEKATAPKTTKTTAKTTEKAAVTTKTSTKQQQQQQAGVSEPAQPSTSSSDYFAALGPMPFEVGYRDDPFLLPGIYTRASNHDGQALSEADARQAMMDLPVYWEDADIFCGTEDDDNGTSNSTYRYIANAFPVPGFSDLQLPAAVDLYIHNGTAAHGSHLRAIDYRFANHPDYGGQYIWTEDEIAGYFYSLAAYADGLYGGHEDVNDSLIAHYRYMDGALDIGYYQRSGGYVLWISRSND